MAPAPNEWRPPEKCERHTIGKDCDSPVTWGEGESVGPGDDEAARALVGELVARRVGGETLW
ncbi:protein of unknown function [Paraburkholderia kururiensis]